MTNEIVFMLYLMATGMLATIIITTSAVALLLPAAITFGGLTVNYFVHSIIDRFVIDPDEEM